MRRFERQNSVTLKLKERADLESGDVLILKKSSRGLVLAPGKRRNFFEKFREVIGSDPERIGRPENWSPSKIKKIWKKAT